jgi:hypothetical protein
VVIAPVRHLISKVCPLLGVLWMFSSCAGGKKAVMAGGTRCVVASAKASFYKNGPAQGGADLELKKGERVVLVSTKLGYCCVKTDAGELGYIADDQLAPAPPEIPMIPKVVRHFPAVNPAMPSGGFEQFPVSPLFGTPGSLDGGAVGPVKPGEDNDVLPPLPEPPPPRF